MGLPIITADQRAATPRGIKMVISGPAKIGKTSLLWTVDPARTLFIDLEAGDLAVEGWAGDTLPVGTWDDFKNVACFLGGPDISARPDEAFSQDHFNYVCGLYGNQAETLAKYDLIFVDSLTVAGRLCFHWCQGQPDAITDKGKPDTRGAYGLHGREMIKVLTHLQHIRQKSVVMLSILDTKIDEYKRVVHELQIDGSKVGRELPGIVDEVICLQMVDLGGDAGTQRAFVCHQTNPNGYPAGDRSGRLDLYEEPHLGKLIAKILGPRAVPAGQGLTYAAPTAAA